MPANTENSIAQKAAVRVAAKRRDEAMAKVAVARRRRNKAAGNYSALLKHKPSLRTYDIHATHLNHAVRELENAKLALQRALDELKVAMQEHYRLAAERR